jgi:hypothetical protein
MMNVTVYAMKMLQKRDGRSGVCGRDWIPKMQKNSSCRSKWKSDLLLMRAMVYPIGGAQHHAIFHKHTDGSPKKNF